MSGKFHRLIESAQNPQFKIWNDLHDGRGIRKHGLFILAGRKLVPEALSRFGKHFMQLIEPIHVEFDELDAPENVDRFRLPKKLFEMLDISGTHYPLLVGSAPALPEADLSSPPRGLELIVALGDPNNLGALMRSAAAFGAKKLILMPDAANPWHPKALRAGANAQFTLTLERGPSWDGLAAARGPIVALDGAGKDMAAYKWPRDLRIVLGEEGPGLPADLKIERLAIPTTGDVESLNATVAASVALYAHYTSVS